MVPLLAVIRDADGEGNYLVIIAYETVNQSVRIKALDSQLFSKSVRYDKMII